MKFWQREGERERERQNWSKRVKERGRMFSPNNLSPSIKRRRPCPVPTVKNFPPQFTGRWELVEQSKFTQEVVDAIPHFLRGYE